MRLIIAAPANGTILKDALKAHLQHDPRIEHLDDLSDEALSYPALSFAAAQKIAAGKADRAILICGMRPLQNTSLHLFADSRNPNTGFRLFPSPNTS